MFCTSFSGVYADAVSTPTAEETTIFNVSNCLETDILIHWAELYKNESPVLKSESSNVQGELLRDLWIATKLD